MNWLNWVGLGVAGADIVLSIVLGEIHLMFFGFVLIAFVLYSCDVNARYERAMRELISFYDDIGERRK